MQLLQVLERNAALTGVDPTIIQRLAERATVRTLRRGEVLFRAGDVPSGWSIIKSGLVKLVRRAPHGRSAICGLFGAPTALADLCVLKNMPFQADAIAASSSVSVVTIPREALLESLRSSSTLALAFACGAAEQITMLNDKIDVLSAGSVEARLAAALLKLYEKLGDDFEDGTSSIPVALSRRELADLVSTSVETVIRVMTRWEREGVLSTEPSGFTLRDMTALRSVAGYPASIAAE